MQGQGEGGRPGPSLQTYPLPAQHSQGTSLDEQSDESKKNIYSQNYIFEN